MESLLRDVRYALRQLRRSPVFALTAVATLAFGIGAATAIFSIVEGVLLRPLPFAEPGRLVSLGDRLEGVHYDDDISPYVTAPGVGFYTRDTHAFTNIGGYESTDYELATADGRADRVNGARLTAGIFPTLGIAPLMGRPFTQQEDVAAGQVVLLSYEAWHNRFRGDPHILGHKILLDRKPYEVIGVMPRGFEFPLVPGQLNRSELWVPMSFTQAELVQGAGNWGYRLVGRLKPGVTPAQAQEDAVTASREIMAHFPPALSRRVIHPFAVPLDQDTVQEARPLVRTLFLAVMVVLFIACTNLAGLLLVRVIRRRREISVRLALGAGSADVLRQYLVEALLLSVTGGALGLALAAIGLRAGIRLLPETLPRISSIVVDGRVAAFAFGLAVLTGLLCGLLPALTASRTSVNENLKEGGRSGAAGGSHGRLRSALVVAELAVALVLLTASGLLLRSFQQMRSVSLGFDSGHVLTASFSLPREEYSTQAAVDNFQQGLRSRLLQLPGVQAVGTTTLLPASGIGALATFTPEGYVPPSGEGLHIAFCPEVTGDYFAAQGIAIVRGRAFTPADNNSAPLVTIVSRGLAEHYWPNQDPIGKRLHRGPAQATTLPWITVIGEIEGVKQLTDEPAEEQFYIPAAQARAVAGPFATASMLSGRAGTIVVRSHVPPDQMAGLLQSTVRSIDPQLPLTQVESMDSVVAEGQAPRRFNTVLISTFATADVALAILGIYSVIAFSTAMRNREMAIRLALGSNRFGIVRLILASGARLGLAGCAFGVIGAFFATRLLRSFVFQVDVLDPAVFTLAAVAILALALLASVIPARRAASVEPMEALRAE